MKKLKKKAREERVRRLVVEKAELDLELRKVQYEIGRTNLRLGRLGVLTSDLFCW